ncbi:uncharacterized protein LOC105763341 [Gossypium raimondii]|uniref:uncharacterized protein LOC105763341 n=1 Tax=Gossypium raimondii TaxID=29730 RepID=UPI00063B06B4|nr:uncharacterized protein LOC105763341 [Gossypium raimondii]
MVGEHRDYLSNVISALVAEKLVHKGCEAYLTYILGMSVSGSNLEGSRTMREFPDIFLEELLRLLPEREVEFGIDLLPGTTPVSIAPYCCLNPRTINIQILREKKLYVKLSKCKSWLQDVMFLGHMVSTEADYYRRFVEGFSLITAPMTKLLRKSAPFKWTEEQQASFEKLKSVLTRVPVLIQPEIGKDYVVYSDVSHIDLGCVLMEDGKVAAYALRQLKSHECNYLAHKIKLAIMVFSLTIWRHYLDKLRVASNRQKSYVDLKRKDIESNVKGQVFLKVSSWKKVLRVGRKGRLSPRFIGPYRILKSIGPMAYKLELPPKLDRIHDVFRISMLRRY